METFRVYIPDGRPTAVLASRSIQGKNSYFYSLLYASLSIFPPLRSFYCFLLPEPGICFFLYMWPECKRLWEFSSLAGGQALFISSSLSTRLKVFMGLGLWFPGKEKHPVFGHFYPPNLDYCQWKC